MATYDRDGDSLRPQLARVLMEVRGVGPEQGAIWRSTTEPPPEDWAKPEFDDQTWNLGPGGFGTSGTPGARVGTLWNQPRIWLRREIELPPRSAEVRDNLRLPSHHDEEAEVDLNGVLAARLSGYTTNNHPVRLRPQAVQALRAGRNTLAASCRQTTGGQFINVGLILLEPPVPEPDPQGSKVA